MNIMTKRTLKVSSESEGDSCCMDAQISPDVEDTDVTI